MGFFEKFFSRKGVTKELELADWEIIGIWKNYLQSVERKSKIVQQMTSENYATFLDQLKELVDLELVEITDEENYGKKYVEDIQRIEHDERIQRVKRLEQTLFYVESKHRYLDKLLEQLHEVLRLQKYYVDSLSGLTVHSFLPALAKTVQEEEAIIKEADLPDFHELFLAIAKGEAMVKRMSAQEKRLVHLMRFKLEPIFNQQVQSGLIYEWASAVMGGLQQQTYSLIQSDALKQHWYVDLEFVNRPEFEDFVRKTINGLRKRPVSEQALTSFVEVFRDWYNHLPREEEP
ncbi:hypothetical protein J4211_02560 [Candidatus Woesearchaeota archaeon]|nr:hypothetical protein [Candidatus Woesearchaeota archaeon]